MAIESYPEPVKSDLLKAIHILKSLGATDVYLFGSILSNEDASGIGDIDFAVAGLPPERFFRAYAALTMSLSTAFDLVDLDNDAAFVKSLRAGGRLERVA